ncbi:YeeE/YedE family protein [Bradyrhizobium sp. 83012]|uniref:YeeE/YedE family protein n=1 Tax=Bradyrhizobium aeschynomenes TaxID=2734909 RepID=A0ABX2C9P5_9BRAD|nr:YeeE/YedE family protein [Bradyrhizobium aeschynomenes]NPU64778.1 YeeE/YedE family protein [Bradyrhizobium aeschynomenes]NPV24454.1 YeeE/YedE family protein [Bradyrhizobium aeschynomenes]
MTVLTQFVVGLVFGLGLLLSGMSNPEKVLDFLDLAAIRSGGWDPSLIFVMAGAVAVTFIGFRLIFRRQRPLLDDRFHLPSSQTLDWRIAIGPAIFGIGWGLAGICPGPAFVALGYGSPAIVLFVVAMLIGMAAARLLASRQPQPSAALSE